MLSHTACKTVVFMAATAWLMSFSSCIVCGFDSYTALSKCPQRKLSHVARSGECGGHRFLLTVRSSQKTSWTRCRETREVWHVDPSCWKKKLFLLLLVEHRILQKCSCKLPCWQSCRKISVQWCASLTRHTKHGFFDPGVAVHARVEGSPPPSTACSANLRGRRDETPHDSLRTGTGLTGPRRRYSEATCSNLLVSQRRPLVTVAQPLHDMAWDLDTLTHVGTSYLREPGAIIYVLNFGLCIILRRMSSVTSGLRPERGLRFGTLATEPVARHFLTNACMALFAGRPLPGNLLPKISRVSLIDPLFMYATTIATLSATQYVILHNTARSSSLNATFN
jgi:hypothetical protein